MDLVKYFENLLPAWSTERRNTMIERLKAANTNTATLKKLSLAIVACVEHDVEYLAVARSVLLESVYTITQVKFTEAMTTAYMDADCRVSKEFYIHVLKNASALDALVDHSLDESLSYYEIVQLLNCSLKRDGRPIERPQHVLMRTAFFLSDAILDSATASSLYDHMARHRRLGFSQTIHAYSGTVGKTLYSRYVMSTSPDDRCFMETARYIHEMLAMGMSNVAVDINRVGPKDMGGPGATAIAAMLDTIPMMVNNQHHHRAGGRARITVSIQPWHPDFVDILKSFASYPDRFDNVQLSLWIPDLFMRRVAAKERWSFFDPTDEPLTYYYGTAFEARYRELERTEKQIATAEAAVIWAVIMSTLEYCSNNNSPIVVFKDNCLTRYDGSRRVPACGGPCGIDVGPEDTGVVTGYINLERFVSEDGGTLDTERLRECVKLMTIVMDKGHGNTTADCCRSLGLSVNGFARAFFKMGVPYDAPGNPAFVKHVMKLIYYTATESTIYHASMKAPYPAWEESSRCANGLIHPDMWFDDVCETDRDEFDWKRLATRCKMFGMRNCTTIGLGDDDWMDANLEPFRRMTLENVPMIDEFVWKKLPDELRNETTYRIVLRDEGSVCNVPNLKDGLKMLLKTARDMPIGIYINLLFNAAPYIDNSAAVYLNVKKDQIADVLYTLWKHGFKTGCSKIVLDDVYPPRLRPQKKTMLNWKATLTR